MDGSADDVHVLCVQGQACVLVLRAMQSRDVQRLLGGAPWTELCVKVAGQLAAVGQRIITWRVNTLQAGSPVTLYVITWGPIYISPSSVNVYTLASFQLVPIWVSVLQKTYEKALWLTIRADAALAVLCVSAEGTDMHTGNYMLLQSFT